MFHRETTLVKKRQSQRQIGAQSGRTGLCSPTTALNSRMSEHRAKPLKALSFLCFGKGCLRSAVQAYPAAPPHVRSEPIITVHASRSL